MPSNVRNDSSLNTGLSSKTSNRVRAAQEERAKAQAAEKELVAAKLGSLSDRGRVIMDWIQEEITATGDMTDVIMNIDSEENVRAQFLARKMHMEFLLKAQTRVKKYLKEDKS